MTKTFIFNGDLPTLVDALPRAVFDSAAEVGAVVYASSDGHVELAQANGEPQACAIGLATEAVLAGQNGEYRTSGPITNPAWSLIPGTVYYLDHNVPGGITSTFPTGNGQYVAIVGTATTPTSLNIEISWKVKLGT